MRKVITILAVTLFVLAFVNPSYAKTTEKSEKVGTYVSMAMPVWIGLAAATATLIGVHEVLGAGLIALGAYKTHKGDWGKDGTEAIKNCVGTHVNGNCGHLKLSVFEDNGIQQTN